MMKEIIKRMQSGRFRTVSEIAKDMGVEKKVLEQPVKFLLEHKYITSPDCDREGCVDCVFRDGCGKTTGNYYSVTDKGRDLLKT